MNKNNELLIWKVAAISVVMMYLYKATKAQGLTLSQTPMGQQINPEAVSNLAAHIVPEKYRQHARKVGSVIMDRFLNY